MRPCAKAFAVFIHVLFLVCALVYRRAATKVTFPLYAPRGCEPAVVDRQEARLFEKYGLDVDMVYVGASPVIVQAMLGGQAINRRGRAARRW